MFKQKTAIGSIKRKLIENLKILKKLKKNGKEININQFNSKQKWNFIIKSVEKKKFNIIK